jgi:hypothetical protein
VATALSLVAIIARPQFKARKEQWRLAAALLWRCGLTG